jgi:hypothetical protein
LNTFLDIELCLPITPKLNTFTDIKLCLPITPKLNTFLDKTLEKYRFSAHIHYIYIIIINILLLTFPSVLLGELEKPKYTVISRNTLVKAEIHLENVEIHLKIVQMNLQWIENGEITHI